MSPQVQSALLFLLAGVSFLLVGSLATAIVVRAVGRRIAGWEPESRHRALVLLAWLPVGCALVLLLSASLPSFLALAAPRFDHCLVHGDSHAHLCFTHLPALGMSKALVLALVFIVTYAVARVALAVAGTLRGLRVVRALARTGLRQPELELTVIESRRPICLAAGLWNPTVLVSRGLLDALDADERAILLAHERAHVRRRDALAMLLVRACATVHLWGLGRWLVREIEIAAEQCCDEVAGEVAGDRAAVAAAILTVERLAQRVAHPLNEVAVAFDQLAVERRVTSLLSERPASGRLRPYYVGLGVIAALLLAAAGQLHHLTESVLSGIAH